MENIQFNNLGLDDDINAAKSIIDDSDKAMHDTYHKYSVIYRATNENISHKPYVDALKDRKKVLSITASGDQIINSILYGGKDIKAVDISSFPKYFVTLKLAALKSLDKEEFLQFIFGKEKDSSTIFPSEIYEKVREVLDYSSREFWDEILKFSNKDENDLQRLFYPLFLTSNKATALNPYLQGDNYDEVKKKIDDVSIDFYDSDILDIDKNSFGYFDLILLSNIINYLKISNHLDEKSESEYNSFFQNLPLRNDGLAVAYNFVFGGALSDILKKNNYKIYKVDEQLLRLRIQNEIIVYKNKPKLLNLIRKK